MANTLRDLRRKMKGITSTKHVTHAMELVAASKMRRAVQNAQQLRRYALLAWRILQTIAKLNPGLHPFLAEQEPKKVLVILFSSDRGLCGSLNTQLFRAASQYVQSLKSLPSFESVSFIAVGRKAQQFLARGKQKVVTAFPALSNHPSSRDIRPIVTMATGAFLKGDADHVVLLYANFISALLQEPSVKLLLPLSETELRGMLRALAQSRTSPRDQDRAEPSSPPPNECLFEPSPEQVLSTVLPQLTHVQVYQAVLESAASEHSARMVAMRNATDNASSILDDLTLTYNQTRQANITAELAELSASKAALE
ncbi:ATP synthase F1 subunit gamma [Candidatus Peregrinibacteria bacterium]|nr:ATP synthase F1 subunit gamma [Candidatus Peregrinibacteria bacterium]MBI3816410.1 ATP synthase F1 subunit gamma [Candidatus Peregrinibacteria bacterium]